MNNIMTQQRSWKLQEFVAHGGAVTCACLGSANAKLLATGGEDNRINIYTVDKPTCIVALSGHNAPVECVKFSPHDNIISGGSRSGVIKLWSLDQPKLLRALSGHASSIYSIDFHPFADYITTGSADTAVKLFDIRKKCCLMTYKGHKDAVRCVRFTPDGHYIVSGGEDYTIRVWDMRQGRQLIALTEHSGAVNCLEFHPHEMLLASGGSDRAVRYWDVDKFRFADSSEPRASTSDIRSIAFHPEGVCLYAGIDNGIRVFSWEPANCLDSVTFTGASGRMADIRVNPVSSQLICVSLMSQTQVVTHALDYGLLAPVADRPSGRTPDRPITSRRSYSANTERPLTSCATSNRNNRLDDNVPGSAISTADPADAIDIKNLDDYKALFNQPQQIPQVTPAQPRILPNPVLDGKGYPEITPRRPQVVPSLAFPVSRNNSNPVIPTPAGTGGQLTHRIGVVDLDDFTPPPPPSAAAQAEIDEDMFCAETTQGHTTVAQVTARRLNALRHVSSIWFNRGPKGAVEFAIQTKDPAVLIDLLATLSKRSSFWDLDLCCLVLPQLSNLVGSKYDDYVERACTSIRLIWTTFEPVIRSTLASPNVGVDIAREERLNKATVCHRELLKIRDVVSKQAEARSGTFGRKLQEIAVLLRTLD